MSVTVLHSRVCSGVRTASWENWAILGRICASSPRVLHPDNFMPVSVCVIFVKGFGFSAFRVAIYAHCVASLSQVMYSVPSPGMRLSGYSHIDGSMVLRHRIRIILILIRCLLTKKLEDTVRTVLRRSSCRSCERHENGYLSRWPSTRSVMASIRSSISMLVAGVLSIITALLYVSELF
jgi:hypothetical protein